MEPTNSWSAGDNVEADDLNQNFTESLNNYRDFTYGETIAVNDAVYLKASDGKVYKTDATSEIKINNFIGFAKEAGNANDVKKVQTGGKISGLSGLTTGERYYLSNTAGEISTTRGTFPKLIGFAISTTELFIKDDFDGGAFSVDGKIESIASADLQHSNDTQKSTTSTSYTKLKEIKINEKLEGVRISFALYAAEGSDSYGIIYKNGVAIGTERTRTGGSGGTETTYDEDFEGPFEVNDLIQVYAKNSPVGTNGYVKNFRLSFRRSIESVFGRSLVTPIQVAPFLDIPTNQDP